MCWMHHFVWFYMSIHFTCAMIHSFPLTIDTKNDWYFHGWVHTELNPNTDIDWTIVEASIVLICLVETFYFKQPPTQVMLHTPVVTEAAKMDLLFEILIKRNRIKKCLHLLLSYLSKTNIYFLWKTFTRKNSFLTLVPWNAACNKDILSALYMLSCH